MDWKKLLYKLSRNIQDKVIKEIPKRGRLTSKKFKELLDNKAQHAIIDTLIEENISAQLISEEGDRLFGDGEFVITADPVDGTTNLSRGLQPSVLSLSVATSPHQEDVIAGIVTNFYTGQTYYADKKRGATLKDMPIEPSRYIQYKDGLIGMDLSKKPRLDKTTGIITKTLHMRAEGCSAASLCHVAEGVLDAHIDFRGTVRATDISAGLFIVKEAGGCYSVNDKLFGDLPLTRETRCTVIATNTKRLLDEIESLID